MGEEGTMQIRMAAEKGAAATNHRWTKRGIHGQSAKNVRLVLKTTEGFF